VDFVAAALAALAPEVLGDVVLGVVGFAGVDLGTAARVETALAGEGVAACLPLGAATEEAFGFGVGASGVVTSGDPFDDRQCPVRIWANA